MHDQTASLHRQSTRVIAKRQGAWPTSDSFAAMRNDVTYVEIVQRGMGNSARSLCHRLEGFYFDGRPSLCLLEFTTNQANGAVATAAMANSVALMYGPISESAAASATMRQTKH